MLTTEDKAAATTAARVTAVQGALGRGKAFNREIQIETGLGQNHVDRALQKLRKQKLAVYRGPKLGWALADAGASNRRAG